MTIKQNILLCLFVSAAFSSFAQDETSSTMLWSDVHITKEINNVFSAKMKLSYFNTTPLLSPRFIDAGFNYQPVKNLNFGLYYRFKGTFETSCKRVYFETIYKKINIKSLGIKISPRIRVQHRLYLEAETNDFHSFQMRPRIMVKKPLAFIPNTICYTSIETFHTTTIEKNIEFSRFRFDLGLCYNVPTVKHQIKISYRHQIDIEKDQRDVTGMINIGYNFRF